MRLFIQSIQHSACCTARVSRNAGCCPHDEPVSGGVRLSGSWSDDTQDAGYSHVCPGSLLLPPSPPRPIPAPSVVAAVKPVLRFVCGPFARLPAHIPPEDPSPHGIAPYLHHLRPHDEGVQPVAKARVAVELRGPLARGHAQLALTLLADVPEQLRLRGAQDRKVGSLGARGRDTGSSGTHEG